MTNRSILVLFFVSLWLVGCASQLTNHKNSSVDNTVHQQHIASLASIKHFTLKGRIGVITLKEGFSGGISWKHQIDHDLVEVYSPFGSKIANIIKTPTDVSLTTKDGNNLKANTVESLTEMSLGWKIPLTDLNDWAIGRPAATKIDSVTWNEQGYITNLKQNGWDIEYEKYEEKNGYLLPNKIYLKSEKLNLKLLVENWSELTN